MLSRVASSIYWIGRYIERVENCARIISVTKNLILDLPENAFQEQWEPMIYTTGDAAAYLNKYENYDKNNVIKFMTVDADNENSILSCVIKARENAISIQNEINSELWIIINDLFHSVKTRISKRKWDDEYLDEFLSEVIRYGHLFTGTLDSIYSHSESWQFAYLGRMLERADKTARIIDTKYYYLLANSESVGSTVDIAQWGALLHSVSAFTMYRRSFSKLNIPNILNFLILNSYFPRSIYYSIARAERALHNITGNKSKPFSCKTERLIGKLRANLEFTDENEIVKDGLHSFLVSIEKKLYKVGREIDKQFFNVHE